MKYLILLPIILFAGNFELCGPEKFLCFKVKKKYRYVSVQNYHLISLKGKQEIVNYLNSQGYNVTLETLAKIPSKELIGGANLEVFENKNRIPLEAKVFRTQPRCQNKIRGLQQKLIQNGVRLNNNEYKRLLEQIELGKQHSERPFFIKSSPGKNPLSLEFYEDGSIFINLKSRHVIIGEGSFKKAKKSIRLNDLSLWVNLKEKKTTEKRKLARRKELDIIRELEGLPGIAAKTYDHIYVGKNKKKKFTMKQAMAEGGDLQGKIRKKRLSLNELQDLTQQIVSTVNAVHERGVIHQDIKPANILISKNKGKDKYILTDFGLSLKQFPTSSVGGTKRYTSPEVLRVKHINALNRKNGREVQKVYKSFQDGIKNDTYALGIMLLETQNAAFVREYTSKMENSAKLGSNNNLRHYEEFKQKWSKNNPTLKNLLQMVHPDPRQRPDIKSFLQKNR